jgi:hypothetical protein
MNTNNTNNRADFPQPVKDALAMAVNYHCVRPGCNRLTHVVPEPSTRQHRHFGAAAHDASASPGGPRPNPEMTREQLKAYDNGAWLCMTCATIVDVLEAWFPPGTLAQWQANAHEMLNRHGVLHNSMPPSQIDWVAAANRAKAFCARVDEIRPHGSGRDLSEFSGAHLAKLEQLTRDCWNLQTPTNTLSALFPHVVSTQARLIDAFRKISQHFGSGAVGWWRDEYGMWRRQPPGWRAPAVQTDTVSEWFHDAMLARRDLVDFYMNRADTSVYFLW